MSRSVQRPPSQGRGYSVREVDVGRRRNRSAAEAASARGAALAPASGAPACGRPAPALARARSWSIGAATRALATSVSRPIWLCHQPLHAIAPSQKFV